MSVVSLEHITKHFILGETPIIALRDINLEVEKGQFMAIVGPSGSGKTTLLNLIGCIDKPTSGIVKIEGQKVNILSSNQLAEIRARKIGFIFQNFNLIPVLSVAENVEYPLLQKKEHRSRKERQAKILRILERVGLSERSDHRPNELSGGERQRVAIARALVTEPSIVLADEPTANLDSQTGANILTLMKELNKDQKTTFIFATHDSRVVGFADQVVELHDGEIISSSYSGESGCTTAFRGI